MLYKDCTTPRERERERVRVAVQRLYCTSMERKICFTKIVPYLKIEGESLYQYSVLYLDGEEDLLYKIVLYHKRERERERVAVQKLYNTSSESGSKILCLKKGILFKDYIAIHRRKTLYNECNAVPTVPRERGRVAVQIQDSPRLSRPRG